jgi:excinuclease UvrABC nuclease subunit
MGYDDVEMATAGEERDAVLRALAEDMRDAAGQTGFVRAERPRDVARAMSRATRPRRTQRPRAA